MKRSIKIGLSLMIIGAVLSLFGFLFGGASSTITWHDGLKVIDRKTRKEKMLQQSYAYDTVKNIEVSTALPVRIIKGDVDKVTVKATAYHELPEVNHTQNDLKVIDKQTSGSNQGKGEFLISGFSWHYNDWDSLGGVTITLPQSQHLSNIQITGQNNGDVQLNDIQSDKIAIQHVADINLKNIKVTHDLTLNDIVDGHLSDVTASTATIQSDDGDLAMQNSQINNRLTIQLGDGDLSMHQNDLHSGEAHTADGDISLLGNRLTDRLAVTTQDGDISASIGTSSVTAKTLDGDLSAFNQHGDDQTSYTHKGKAGSYVITTDSGDVAIKR